LTLEFASSSPFCATRFAFGVVRALESVLVAFVLELATAGCGEQFLMIRFQRLDLLPQIRDLTRGCESRHNEDRKANARQT